MFKKNEIPKVVGNEFKRVVLGQLGLSRMGVDIQPDKSILLWENFFDPNYKSREPFEDKPFVFTVQMCIRAEYVPQILRVLAENGFNVAKELLPKFTEI